MHVPCICNFSGLGKYVVVFFLPPSFGLWTQKQLKSLCSCDMKLLFIMCPGNNICHGIKPKLLLRFFFLITFFKSGKNVNLLLIFSSIPLCHYLSVFLYDYCNSCWTLCVSYMTIEQFSGNFFLSLVSNSMRKKMLHSHVVNCLPTESRREGSK